MRTIELMREYVKDESYATPSGGWERLVWHAADLLRMASKLRNTYHKARGRSASPYVQGELFGNERR